MDNSRPQAADAQKGAEALKPKEPPLKKLYFTLDQAALYTDLDHCKAFIDVVTAKDGHWQSVGPNDKDAIPCEIDFKVGCVAC